MKSRHYMIRGDVSQFLGTSNFLACNTALAAQAETHSLALSKDQAFMPASSTVKATVLSAGRAYLLSNSLEVIPERWTVFIADLGDPLLFLRHPLPVIVESTGTQVCAYSYDLEELAVGTDEGAAITEMKALIAESYILLRDEQESLGPLQRQHWAFLRRLIGEVEVCPSKPQK